MKRTRTQSIRKYTTAAQRGLALFIVAASSLAMLALFAGCDLGTYNSRFEENRVNRPGQAPAPAAPAPEPDPAAEQ